MFAGDPGGCLSFNGGSWLFVSSDRIQLPRRAHKILALVSGVDAYYSALQAAFAVFLEHQQSRVAARHSYRRE